MAQLTKQYAKSDEWVRTKLAAYQPRPIVHVPRPVVVILDVTYFGSWGVLVIIDPNVVEHQNLVLYYVWLEGTERTVDYEVALDTLDGLGYKVEAATIDGRRGVREMLLRKGIAVQHCQFHQLLTITQCLTKRPKLPANQQLRAIALTLTRTTKTQLEAALDQWHATHGDWLKERDPQTKQYVHRRTRQAYFSLRRNLPYLFTFQEEGMAGKPAIANTTNALDGRFGVWKTILNRHRGCTKKLKTTMLRSLFSGRTD